jgi:glycosyltransferase involved in cell wall biosynthesis
VLADCEPGTMNLSPAAVEAAFTPRTRAILPVHFAGRMCDMDSLMAIAERHDLVVIEDCAHAIESSDGDHRAGTVGDFGVFSFYATKNLSTGEGGMVVARRAEHAERLDRLSLHGMSADAWKRFGDEGFKRYDVVERGFKYNMMDLQAALGIHQLARLESNWERRRELWRTYQELLRDLPLDLPQEPAPGTRHAHHLYTVLVRADAAVDRDTLLDALTARRIGVGVHYLALPEHPLLPGGPGLASGAGAGRGGHRPAHRQPAALPDAHRRRRAGRGRRARPLAVRLLLFGDWEPEAPGGPGAVALFLARELVLAGHSVLVVSAGPGREVVRSSFEDGIDVVRVPSWRGPRLRRATRAFLRSADADADGALLLSVFIPMHVLAARALRCPYVVLPLGGYAAASVRARGVLRKHAWLAAAERRHLERAAAIDVWSRNEQADVERLCRPARVLITPPGLPHGVVAAAPRPLRDSRRLLYLGRFATPQKGLDRLVTEFGRIAGPQDRLTLAGSDHRGGLRQLQALVAEAGLQDKVDFRGPAYGDVKADLFAEHDVFVHLSRWEGLPLAVVEAMAAGLPVVVTEETNVADLVAAYGAGWVADGRAARRPARRARRHAAGAPRPGSGRDPARAGGAVVGARRAGHRRGAADRERYRTVTSRLVRATTSDPSYQTSSSVWVPFLAGTEPLTPWLPCRVIAVVLLTCVPSSRTTSRSSSAVGQPSALRPACAAQASRVSRTPSPSESGQPPDSTGPALVAQASAMSGTPSPSAFSVSVSRVALSV